MRPRVLTRAGVGVIAAAAVMGLGYGPAQHYLDPAPAAGASADLLGVQLLDDPSDPPQLPTWPVGVVSSGTSLPGGGDERPEPPVTPVTFEEAARSAAQRDTISVVGPPRGPGLLGVGAVVTANDVTEIAALPLEERTRVVRYLAAADGAALSVGAVDAAPGADLAVVRREGGEVQNADLLEAHPAVAGLLLTWAQIRPELAAIVDTDPDGGSVPPVGLAPSPTPRASTSPGTAAWRGAVSGAVTREILPELDLGHVPLAPELLAGPTAGGLVELDADGSRLTARGAAYAVAARVVQPGSRAMAARSNGPVQARAFSRPGGGAGLLLYNPGRARTVTLQLPDGDRTLRVTVALDGRAVSGVVLGSR